MIQPSEGVSVMIHKTDLLKCSNLTNLLPDVSFVSDIKHRRKRKETIDKLNCIMCNVKINVCAVKLLCYLLQRVYTNSENTEVSSVHAICSSPQ